MSHRNDGQGRDMDMGFAQETDYNNGMSFDDMDDGYDTPPDPDADLIDYTKTYTPIAKPDLNIMRTMEDSQILAYPLHSRSLQRKDSVSELPRTPQKSPPQSRLFQSSLPELELHTPGHFNSTNYPTPHLHRDAAQRYFQDNFRNVEVVGKGSFSTVYKATHIQDGRNYAIKISTNKLKGKRQRKKVVDEIKAVASLNNPHVLSYLFAWEQDNTVYIQMELCEKGSLSSFLSEFMAKNPHGKLPEPLIWSYLCDITLGLHYIHRRNLLHLDIKPANIFISSRNYLVIGDFGQVTNLDESSREAGDSRYMAPETLNFPPTQESDLFSMGATIFEVASLLEMPKGGAYWRVLRGSEPNVDQSQLIYNALGPYSDDLKSVILSLMKNDPNHRITTAQILQLPHIKQVLADRFQRFDFDYRKSIDATLSLNSVSQNVSHNGSMSVPSNGRTLSQSNMLFTPQSSYGGGQSSLMADEDFFVSPPEPSSAERHGSAHSDRPGLSFGSKLKRNLAQAFDDDDEADTSGDFL